jgi:uncharacterized protein YbdZ (MbtH family)
MRAKSAKFGFPRGELRWAFVVIVLCCFFLYDLLCLPSRCCPREEAQIWLLRHFTQSRDGALDFVLKLWIFYRPHLVSNGAENWCASYLSVTKLEKKLKKIRARSAKLGFVLVASPRGELCWAFLLIVLCCVFLRDLLCLSSQCCPREEAQIWLLRHFTQSRDGALDFVLKL